MHDELQRHNRIATVVLLISGFLLLFLTTLAAQYLVFGVGGGMPATLGAMIPLLVVAVLVAGAGSAVAWWKSDAVALRSARARPAEPTDHADLHRLVEGLALAAGIPKPRLYVVDDPAPNAFATGRNPDNAAVAVTTGLLERLDRRELEAVLAHELGHVRNNDLLTVTVAVTLAGATMLLADLSRRALWFGGGRGRRSSRDGGGGAAAIIMLVVSILVLVIAPIAAQLIRFAVSRQREYLADATAVEFTRDPASMIGALEALKQDTTEIRTASRATAHLWIEEPMNLEKRRNRAVATHPPLDDRIERLRNLWPEADPGSGGAGSDQGTILGQ